MEYLVSEDELKKLIESVSIVKSFDNNGINISLGNPKGEVNKWVDKIKSKQPVEVIYDGKTMYGFKCGGNAK